MPKARMTKAEREARLNEWIDLRLSGWAYDRIAQQYNVRKQTVHGAVMKALKERTDRSVDEYRAELIEQHDMIIDVMTVRAKAGDPQAAAQVLRALSSKAVLLGANAVETKRLEISTSDGTIDEQIA